MEVGADEKAELRALREQRDALDRELVRKSFRIGELEQEHEAELARLTHVFEDSLSWKVTRPLRSLRLIPARFRHLRTSRH